MLFFISLWVPGCSLMAPKPCKNAGFSSCKQKNTVNMQVIKCICWGSRAPKNSQLGLLRRGVGTTFKLLCRTRKHCKNYCFWHFLVLWGLAPPPTLPLPYLRGFATMFFLHPKLQNCLLRWHCWALFLSKILQVILLQISFETKHRFYEKHTKPWNLRGKTQFGQKAARAKIQPNRMFHLSFTVKSHFACFVPKSSFWVECNETLQKCSQNLFFWSLKPFKKLPLKRIFPSRPQEKET